MNPNDPKPASDTIHNQTGRGQDMPSPSTPRPVIPPTNVSPTNAGPGFAVRRQIGRYTVLKELGRGGMGVVYLAHQDDLNREVALKVITAGPDADPTELARFYAEAETAANLHHPNIVQVYEVGQADHLAFLAMEYVRGGNLYRRIGKQPMPIREAAAFLEPVARAMYYAHQHGVIHRDLKPSNILLEEPEPASQTTPRDDSRLIPGVNLPTPKIADFGLAKRLDRPMNLTVSGVAIGTPHYMAPEQARGDATKIGPLTDVYALGTILYEMLVGFPPFNGSNSLETMEYVVGRKPVPPSQLRAGIPPELEAICMRCLEKRPTDRYPHAEALADALKVFLTGEVISTVHDALPAAQPTPTVRFGPLLLGAMLATPIAVFTTLIANRPAPTPETVQAEPTESTAGLKAEIAKWTMQERFARFHVARGELEQGNVRDGLLELQRIADDEAKQSETPSALKRQAELLRKAWLPYQLEAGGVVQHPDVSLVTTVGGKQMFASAGGSTVRLWDSQTHKQLGRDFTADGRITAIAVSSNGQFVAVATINRKVTIWQLANQQRVGQPIEWREGGSAVCLQFVEQDTRLRVGIEDDALRTYHVLDGTAVGEPLKLDQARAWKHWATHPNGFTVAVDDADSPYAWNIDAAKVVAAPPSSIGPMAQLAMAPSARHWAARTRQGAVKVYARDEGRWLDLPGTGTISAFNYSPDGNMMAMGRVSGAVRIWDAVARSPLTEAVSVGTPVVDIAMGDGGMVVVATASGKIHTFRFNARPYAAPPVWLENKPGKEVLSVMFSAEGTRLYVTSPYGVSRWVIRPGAMMEVDREYPASKRMVPPAKSPKDQFHFRTGVIVPPTDRDPEAVLVGASEGRLFLIDSGKETNLANGQLNDVAEVTTVAVSREGGTTSACGQTRDRRGVLTYWTQGMGVGPGRSHALDYVVNHEVFSRNAREIILGCSDGSVRRLDVTTDTFVGEPLNCGSPVLCVAINDVGNRIFAGCADGTAHLWDIDTNKERYVVHHAAEVRAVAFAKGLLSAGADGTLRLWDEESGLPLGPPWRHADSIVALAVRGDLVITASRDRVLRLWRLP